MLIIQEDKDIIWYDSGKIVTQFCMQQCKIETDYWYSICAECGVQYILPITKVSVEEIIGGFIA